MITESIHQQTGLSPVQPGFFRPYSVGPMTTASLGNSESIQQRFQHVLADDHYALNELEKAYVFFEPAVRDVLMNHRELIPLLRSAVEKLRSCFGRETLLHLRVPVDESGARTVYVIVIWKGSLPDVRRAFAEFDNDWWLIRAARAKGIVTFTYELV